MGASALTPCPQLSAGEVGYLTASIKNVRETRVGDTVTLAANPTAEPMPGYRKATPMVFCGIYTVDGAKYPDLKDALEKLQLNDAEISDVVACQVLFPPVARGLFARRGSLFRCRFRW